MYFFENASAYDNMQISFHEIKDEVKILIVFGFDDVEQSYDIIVAIELLKEHDFAECSLGVSGIVKGVEYFFEGYDSF
jgi:hypothetical protein